MARAFEREVVIGRPVAEVWSTLVDWSTAPRWMSGIERIAANGPVAPGTQLTFSARGRVRPAEILEAGDGRLVVRSEQGPVSATYCYEVEATPGGTRFRLTVDCDVRGPLRLLAPLVGRTLRRTDGGQPDALRSLLEA
ncbi:MAG: SRPBCC family protein [Actinomycetota bacterium]